MNFTIDMINPICYNPIVRGASTKNLKKYIILNPEKKKVRDKKYHLINREKRLQYLRSYQAINKQSRSEKYRQRYASDHQFRLLQNIRNRIRMAIMRNSKFSSTIELIGCTIHELQLHLQGLFKPGMTWDNYGRWQVDHILPCSSFDLSVPEQQKKCFNFSNLQPLWADENLLKSNKIMQEREVCHR